MKALILFLFPVLVCSQNITIDTTGLDKQTQANIVEILKNVDKRHIEEKKLLAEKEQKIKIQKQVLQKQRSNSDLIKEIKYYIFSRKSDKADAKTEEQINQYFALKPEGYMVDIPAQEIKWEQHPKRGIKRLFSNQKYTEIPYIVDIDNNTIYLQKK